MNTQTIDFGKFYELDELGVAKKRAVGWVWRCGCSKCRKLPSSEGLRGPFKTRRAAERDAQQCLTLMWCDRDNMGTA